jgi:hypothetical protein
MDPCLVVVLGSVGLPLTARTTGGKRTFLSRLEASNKANSIPYLSDVYKKSMVLTTFFRCLGVNTVVLFPFSLF